MASTRDLEARYGSGQPALAKVSFVGRAGQRIGVLGPNGGGKSTLFRVLIGDLKPSAGEYGVAERPALVPQTERSRLDYPVSALDVVLMGAVARLPWWRRPSKAMRLAAREALGRVALGEHAEVTFGELSGGQRQRVLVARALFQNSRLLLLDEPFSGVDDPSVGLLMRLIDRLADEACCVMIATHDIDQARRWDAVLCLNREQVDFGPPAAVLTREVLELTYGASIVLLPDGERAQIAGIPPAHHHPQRLD